MTPKERTNMLADILSGQGQDDLPTDATVRLNNVLAEHCHFNPGYKELSAIEARAVDLLVFAIAQLVGGADRTDSRWTRIAQVANYVAVAKEIERRIEPPDAHA